MNTTENDFQRTICLLEEVDNCSTISELFELVRNEKIDIRMQTLCSASNIPPKMFNHDPESMEPAFERLKKLVKLAIEHNR
ncbi:MAG: hypothetical protein IKB72_04485 [Ruminococcus sp.]|nr:hypothetical protein [Oscillospiraceae bacterium]MBR2724674.1 hypothetical protein [Ruminococcus sp.]